MNASSVNGHFEGYIIEYKRDDVDREPTRVFSPVGTTHKVNVTIFEKNVLFIGSDKLICKFQLYGCCEDEKSSIHEQTEQCNQVCNARRRLAKMKRFLKWRMRLVPSKVHDLRVYAVGATSILLKWSPPLTPNGVVRGYFISFHDDRSMFSS